MPKLNKIFIFFDTVIPNLKNVKEYYESYVQKYI